MRTITKLLTRFPFFLALLPAFVVIHFEKEFHKIVHYKFMYDRILILFAMPVLLFLIFYLFLRSVRKSSLMALGFLVFFCYAGELKNWLTKDFPGTVWQSYSFIFSVSLVLLIVLFFILKKSKSELSRPYLYINSVLILFILADVLTMFLSPISGTYKIISETVSKSKSSEQKLHPDIYYIIADAYSSSKYLLTEYGYSNHGIEEYLKSKSFFIVPESRSNYNYTAYSLGSIFNMNYIENVDTSNKITDREYLQALKLIQKNRVFSFFHDEGYRIVNHSIFDINRSPTTINDIEFWNLNETFDQYNLLFKLFHDIGYHFPSKMQNLMIKDRYYVNSAENRERLSRTQMTHLLETIKYESKEPKFVYTHFLEPHPPYFFDSSGMQFKNTDIEKGIAYLHQVSYFNRMIKKITDSIMAYRRRPTVIIIQGDHGLSFAYPEKKKDFFPNFNAVYFSTKEYGLFNDSTHSVNTFRIVLNTFFKKRLELLPYKSWFINM